MKLFTKEKTNHITKINLHQPNITKANQRKLKITNINQKQLKTLRKGEK